MQYAGAVQLRILTHKQKALGKASPGRYAQRQRGELRAWQQLQGLFTANTSFILTDGDLRTIQASQRSGGLCSGQPQAQSMVAADFLFIFV